MKHRGSFRSAASALGVLLYVLSLSPAASAEVLTIGSDSEMTYAEDTVFENASSESTLSMGSGNTWDNDSSEQVTITNADGSFAVKGPRAGIYVPSGKTLTMKAQELTLLPPPTLSSSMILIGFSPLSKQPAFTRKGET